MGQDSEIRSVQIGIGVAAKYCQPLAVADPIFGRRNAAGGLHHLAVWTGEGWHPMGLGAFNKCRKKLAFSCRRVDFKKTTRAAPFGIGSASPVFDPAIDFQHTLI